MCRFKLFAVIVPLVFCFIANGQPILSYPANSSSAKVSWPSVQPERPELFRMILLEWRRDDFMAYRDTARYMLNIDSLYSHLHFVSLIGDDKSDVIFDGKDTSEGNIVQFFVHSMDSYDKVFEAKQGLTRIDWNNKKIEYLYISDWGCCADYINFEKIYKADYTGMYPRFNQVYQAAVMFNGTEPTEVFDKPFYIKLRANCELRARPETDDTSLNPWQEDDSTRGTGNVIAKLPVVTKSLALGKQTDKTGIEWWYVELDESCPLIKSVFYENDNKFPSKKRGWVSSRYVSLIP